MPANNINNTTLKQNYIARAIHDNMLIAL